MESLVCAHEFWGVSQWDWATIVTVIVGIRSSVAFVAPKGFYQGARNNGPSVNLCLADIG